MNSITDMEPKWVHNLENKVSNNKAAPYQKVVLGKNTGKDLKICMC